MLGEFSITYGDMPILLQQGRDNKVQLLLQYFLYNHNNMMSTEDIYNDMYSVQDAADPAHLIRVNVYRLKKVISESALPEHNYIQRTKRTYHWTRDIPCETDVDNFTVAAKTALSAAQADSVSHSSKLEACRKALDLYTGELLPGRGDRRWVAVESLKLKRIYIQCIDTMANLCKESKEYDELLEYMDRALVIYPSEEALHSLKMSCLFELRRFPEAIQAFNIANNAIYTQLGVPPSKKLLALYSKMSQETMGVKANLNNIKDSLTEGPSDSGAYYSSYPTFVEAYRIVARTAERSGQSVYLMLLELNIDESEQQEERAQNAMNSLETSIGQSLRRGDLFTRYSAAQFLLLLLGINKENCEIVFERIKRNWKQEWNGRRIHLSHREISSVDAPSSPATLSFREASKLWGD